VLQEEPINATFTSNADAELGRGFNIDKLRFCCGQVPGGSMSNVRINGGERNTGILLGHNDVVHFHAPGPSGYPGDVRLNIAAWSAATVDLDLYARCGTQPTYALFTKRSWSADRFEFLQIAPADCQFPDELHIAVHSYPNLNLAGSGRFDIVVSRADLAGLSLNVAVESTDPATLTQVQKTLTKAARRFYGATEGQVLYKQFNVVSVPATAISSVHNHFECALACIPEMGNTCQICFITNSGTRMFTNWNGADTIVPVGGFADYWQLTHEFGHQVLKVEDEYDEDEGFCSMCGHSLMADHGDQHNNFCFEHTGINHNLDRDTGCNPAFTDSVWDEAEYIYFPPHETLDRHDYIEHDFGNLPQVIFQ